MVRKFAEGLVFGAGFAIAFFVLGAIGLSATLSKVSGGRDGMPIRVTTKHIDEEEGASDGKLEKKRLFHELPIEEQIAEASVIALARFEPAEDGRMQAIIKEIVKKQKDVEFYYEVGEEFANSSYYPRQGTSYGDGLVIFFEGSPAMMRRAISYSGDRITGLGDMPIELFRKKCGKDDA